MTITNQIFRLDGPLCAAGGTNAAPNDHCWRTGFALCGVPVAGGFAVVVSGLGVESDLMYAPNPSNCSSVNCPWNAGITGPNPVTFFAGGLMLDSRRYPSSAFPAGPLLTTTLLPYTPPSAGPRPP